ISIASSEKEDALIVAANRARTVFYAICLRNSDFWAGVSPRNTAANQTAVFKRLAKNELSDFSEL
ncbi:MAG: hypothetical protein WA709_26625, partial [Stellaceae bacterium]